MSNNISTIDMSHEDWLQARKRGLGGSDAAAILGLNPYRTALDVYNEKIAPEPVVIEETPRMKAGKKLENVIAEYYEEETGHKLLMDNRIRVHPDYPFILGNMDRVIQSENGSGPGIFEAKSTSSMYAKTWEHEIPLSYFCQIQHYFLVTGYTWGEIAILIDGWDFKHYPLKPADEYIKLMFEKLTDFWYNHVEKRIPPPPMNEKDLKTLYERSVEGKRIEATDEDVIRAVQESDALKAEIAELSKQRKIANEKIKLFMEDAEILTDGDFILATWKSGKDRLVFDQKRFKADYPELFVQYSDMKPGNRTLLIK